MLDLRPVAAVIGILLAILAGLMLIPTATAFMMAETDAIPFLAMTAITAFASVSFWLVGRRDERTDLSIRQAFLLTALAWIVTSGFAAMPFVWGSPNITFAAAYFEAMSALTTTGGTAIVGLDTANASVLVWRSILHFYGGIGIVVIAIAILPLLQIGGMQLFRTESSDKSEKLFPRAAQIASATIGAYVSLNVACMFAYMWAGMDAFDAFNHALSTIATGGMSVSDSSLGKYQSAAVDWVAIAFMIAGALPLLLFIKMTFGGHPLAILRSEEVRTFISVIVGFAALLWLYQELSGLHTGHDAIRYALFNVVTLVTTTGFATVDYTNWGAFSDVLLFLVTFLGGCTGSTAGGIKAFRLIVMGKALAQQVKSVIYPNGVFAMRFEGKPITTEVVASVMNFFVLYLLTFLVIGTALTLTGLEFKTAFSATIANLANTGPGLGAQIGPVGNYANLAALQYWLLSFAMLVGRLEIVTIFVLFLPRFWRP